MRISILILLLSPILVFAQYGEHTSRGPCIDDCQRYHSGTYSASLASTSPAGWCRYWSLECSCLSRACPGIVNCVYTSGIGSSSCTVRESIQSPQETNPLIHLLRIAVVDPDAVPPGTLVPVPVSASSPRPRTFPGYSSSALTQPDATGTAPSAERRPASVGTAAISVVLVIGAAIGSLIGAKVAISSGGSSGGGSSAAAAGASAITGSVLLQCPAAVDPVSLLIHFQFISQSGFLSLAYPANYLGFTFNFAWANFVVPMSAFQRAAVRMTDLARCWSGGGSGTAGGFEGVAERYGVP